MTEQTRRATKGCESGLAIEEGRHALTRGKLDIVTLLAGITDENSHELIATGARVGDEFW